MEHSENTSGKVKFSHTQSPDQKPEVVEEKALNKQNNRLVILIFVMLFIGLFGAYLWGALAISTGMEFGFLAAGIGLVNGLIAHFFKQERREYLYPTFAIITSFIGYLMAKYMVFKHFIEPANPEVAPEKAWELSWAYFTGINGTNLQAFISRWGEVFGLLDLGWLMLMYIGVRSLKIIGFSNNFTPTKKRGVDRGKFKSRFRK